MKRLYTLAALALAVFLVLSFAVTAVAQADEQGENRGRLEERRTEVQENRASRAEERIETLISRVTAKKEKFASRFERIEKRIGRLIAKLGEKGYDTAALSKDLETFKDKVARFVSDSDSLIDGLEQARKYAAAGSVDDLREAVKAARDQAQVVRRDARETNKYFRTVIKADIRAIRDQEPATAAPEPDI